MPAANQPVLCGPLIRYTDRANAVIWLELDRDLEMRLELSTVANQTAQVPMIFRAWPVQVGETFYAWIRCQYLLPDTWYSYRILGIDEFGEETELWPNRALSGNGDPSIFRTLPMFGLNPVRVCFGSCRAGFPPTDPKALEEGMDALNLLAEEIVANTSSRDSAWPHLFILGGDQIYGDTLSAAKQREFMRRSKNPVVLNHATTYAQYAALYREAWTTVPHVRWMLSCIPSFMIFDDHDVTDDWNITQQWLAERLVSQGWVGLMRDALLAYWVYQGAGNLPPKNWLGDERARWLMPKYRSPLRDVTRRITSLFEQYIRRRRQADWGFSIDVPGMRFAVADTRMSRKLTGKRLLMDDDAWTRLVQRAKDNRARHVVIVVPCPVLVGYPMHDLLSRIAESIEGNPPSIVGAIAGGLVGTLIGGPVGGLAGTIAGSVGGEYLLDKYGEDIIRKADVELWAAFPSSFNRMVTLWEQLTDGVGTFPKRFIGVIAGDVHHSNIMQGELKQTLNPKTILHFTMSPLQRFVSDSDRSLLKDLEGGTWYVDAVNTLERPGFVEQQRDRINWYPLDRDGAKSDFRNIDNWDFFGKFIGELEIGIFQLSYRYRQAVAAASQPSLQDVTRRDVWLI